MIYITAILLLFADTRTLAGLPTTAATRERGWLVGRAGSRKVKKQKQKKKTGRLERWQDDPPAAICSFDRWADLEARCRLALMRPLHRPVTT